MVEENSGGAEKNDGPAGRKSFIPIYPNTLPTVPKPPGGSRAASLVFKHLPASQGAITRLLNRCRGQNSYRGFESPLSAIARKPCKDAAICAVLLLFCDFLEFNIT